MRRIASIVTLMAVTALAACGQVEPVILAVSMPDCTVRGATKMEPGTASLSLTLNGLGRAGGVLVELSEGHSYEELADHFEESGDWVDRPSWVHPIIEVELSDSDGVDGIADSSDLGVGEYAVVCVDLETGRALVASRLQVEESVSDVGEDGDGGRGRRP